MPKGGKPDAKAKGQEPRAKNQKPLLVYPRSASASSLPKLGLCFSFLVCFLFSARFTGGGVPSTALDAALTALVALNFLSFFFLGTEVFNHEETGRRSL
jgi:hypothetical protein